MLPDNIILLGNVLRLLFAMVLGGLIGLEREYGGRPAGFRTHTLVCMGSALVMITSQHIFSEYNHLTSLDPARLGAQVISGIGFLGAGTILNDGNRVRGLTTAACLWLVACVGLSVGAGFYLEALAATVFALITLFLLKKIEGILKKDRKELELYLSIRNDVLKIADVIKVLEQHKVQIKNIKITGTDETFSYIKLLVMLPLNLTKKSLTNDLSYINGLVLDMQD